MSNPISSPYADFIQEQKKQKYLKNIDVLMVSSYHVEFYKVIIELQKSIINTLHKNNNKILNKNTLKKINDDINKVLPYEKYGIRAYHKKPSDIFDKNKIYVYSHKSNNFNIDEYTCDVIISESAKERKTETLLKSEKINYDVIHNLNVRCFSSNIQELKKWEKIKASSYDIQYRVDQINSLKKELDNFVKLFDESEGYKHSNYSVMELIKDTPRFSENMYSWLRKQDNFMVSIDELRKQNK